MKFNTIKEEKQQNKKYIENLVQKVFILKSINQTVLIAICLFLAYISYQNLQDFTIGVVILSQTFAYILLYIIQYRHKKIIFKNKDIQSLNTKLLDGSPSYIDNIKTKIIEHLFLCLYGTMYISIFELLMREHDKKEQIVLITQFLSLFSNMQIRRTKRVSIRSWFVIFLQLYSAIRIQLSIEYDYICLTLNIFNLIYSISFINSSISSNYKKQIQYDDEKQKIQNVMKLYQSILSIIPEGLAVVNQDKKLLYANPTLKKILQSNKKTDILNILMNLGKNNNRLEQEINKSNQCIDQQLQQSSKTQQHSHKQILDQNLEYNIQLSQSNINQGIKFQKEDNQLTPSKISNNQNLIFSQSALQNLQALQAKQLKNDKQIEQESHESLSDINNNENQKSPSIQNNTLCKEEEDILSKEKNGQKQQSSQIPSREQMKSTGSHKSNQKIKKIKKRDSSINKRRKTMNQGTNQSINNFISDQSEILSYKGFGFGNEEEMESENMNLSQKHQNKRQSDILNRQNKSDLLKSCPNPTRLRKSQINNSNVQYTNNKHSNLRYKHMNNQSYQPDKNIIQINSNDQHKLNQLVNQNLDNSNHQYSEKKFSPTGNNIFQLNQDQDQNQNQNNQLNQSLNLKEQKLIDQNKTQQNKLDNKTESEKKNIYLDKLKQQINEHQQYLDIQGVQNESGKNINSHAFEKINNNINSNNLINLISKQKDQSTFTLKVKTRKNTSQNEVQSKIALKKTDVSDIIDKMLQSSPNNQNLENKFDKDKISCQNDEENKHQNYNNKNYLNQQQRKSFTSQLKRDDKGDLSYFQQTDRLTKIQVKYKSKDLVLQFLTVDVVTENQKNDTLVLVIVQDMWQDLYQQKVSDIQKDKMRIFASLSHELRTPLNCSISMLEVLKDEISRTNSNYIEEYLNPALFSNKLLLNQINDILDFVQMDSGKFKYSYQDFSIGSLLKDCQKLISMQAQMKNIQIKISQKQSVSEIICSDPNRIRQILLNFLSNSLKFTQKGYIEIGIHCTEINAIYEIYVKDTGIGITKENLETIFQFCNKINYEKKDEGLNSQGCGLGLTISNSIAKGLVHNQQFEGGVKVSSEYGQGSIFSIIVQDMNENRQLCQNMYENLSQEQQSPKRIVNMKKSIQIKDINLKKPLGKKVITYNFISPSQVILEDDYSIDQNTSVDQLKQINFKNNRTEVQNINDSFSNERNILKSQFLRGITKLDSTTILEVDDENNKYVQVNSNLSVKNDRKRFQEESNYQYFPKLTENKPQISTSQYSPSNKISQKSLKLQYYKTLEQLSQSEVQNNQTSENMVSNRQMNSDAAGIYDNSVFENKERSNKDQEGFTSYVGFGRFLCDESPSYSISKVFLHSFQNVDRYKSLKTSNRDLNCSKTEYSEEEEKRQLNCMDTQMNPQETINQIIKLNMKQKIMCDCPQIMIVDDNQFNLYALTKTAQQFQFSCKSVSDGNQAIEEIKSIYKENCCLAPKIIFMDIEMPIKNGYQVAQEINKYQEEIHLQKKSTIIACTAYIGQEDHDKAIEAGMDDFINKPILKNAFEQLILNWQNLFL